MSEEQRAPATKLAVASEGAANVGVGGAIIAACIEAGLGTNLSLVIGMIAGTILPVIGSFIRDWMAARRAKFTSVGIVFLALLAIGCGGSVTIAECTHRVDQAQVLKLGCGEFKTPAAQAQCIGIADAAIAAARAGCQFAEPEVVAVAE